VRLRIRFGNRAGGGLGLLVLAVDTGATATSVSAAPCETGSVIERAVASVRMGSKYLRAFCFAQVCLQLRGARSTRLGKISWSLEHLGPGAPAR
jgi:hypothetical protein